MAKESAIQNSFNAGELTPRVEGRTDYDKYRSGCQILENFIPSVNGSLDKRPGTRYVAEVKDSNDTTILIPFEFSTEQAYVLEFGDQYMRVFKDGFPVFDSSLPGLVPYEIATPFVNPTINQLRFTQSADVLYIASGTYPPQRISRFADDLWTITEINFLWPPFQAEPLGGSILLYASGNTGTINITSTISIFTSDSIGNYIKFREIISGHQDEWETNISYSQNDRVFFDGNVYIKNTAGSQNSGTRPPVHLEGTESDGGVEWTYLHSGEGYARITLLNSGVSVTATVESTLPSGVVGSGNATDRYAFGFWSSLNGYPTVVAFYEERLIFASSTSFPQTIWGSRSGDFENHQSGVNDDDAYIYTINSDKVNKIEWMTPSNVLTIGTAGSEFIMSASSRDEPITPTNVRISRQSSYGCSPVKSIRVGSTELFIQRSQRKVRELAYDFETDSYLAPDLTILSEHITRAGLIDVAFQQEPDQIFWFALADGSIACLTYEKTENVFAWHRHQLGGEGDVESIVSIPHPDGDQDQLWMVVKRTINGATKRYIERLRKHYRDGDGTGIAANSFYSDSHIDFFTLGNTTLTGLDHLEGETVTILADGAAHEDKVVTSGSVTLDRDATFVTIGLPYTATMQTMRFDAGAADGTAQGKTKRITNVVIRLYETGPGLWIGPDTVNMEEIYFRDSTMNMDEAVPLFSGDKGPREWPEGYEMDARVTVQHRLPLPCSILAVMPQMITQDR